MDINDLAVQFRLSARHFRSCPLYEHILRVVANSDDVLGIVSQTPKGPQPTNLLLASVHYLLLREPGEELAQWCESIVDDPLPVETVDEAFVTFCLEKSDQLVALLKTRLVQTNEVARTIPLRAALAYILKEFEIRQPCDYVEIGASAGLLMAFEAYRYEVGDQVLGSETSPLTLSTTWEGDPLPLEPLPVFQSIKGIDLHPVDLNDPDERLWLHALVWPNAHHRRAQLDAAFSAAENHDVSVEAKDVVDWVETQLEAKPTDTPLLVFHAAVRAHMPRQSWEVFEEKLVSLSSLRPVFLISMESDLAALNGHVTWIAPLSP